MIEGLQLLIGAVDYALDTKRKRHLVGGILLSVSLLFGGLALTSFTLKEEDDDVRRPNKVDERRRIGLMDNEECEGIQEMRTMFHRSR